MIQDRLVTECIAGRVIRPLLKSLTLWGTLEPGKWGMIETSPHLVVTVSMMQLTRISVPHNMYQWMKIILSLGKATLLAKFDIENAYRLIPVHPSDPLLLGMEWGGQLYVDTSLPFGLRSAPQILMGWQMRFSGFWTQKVFPHYYTSFTIFYSLVAHTLKAVPKQ